ncbi:Cpq [Phodopus roborovskii]|uniref:Cpq protein n=1 Tax=Phodopus roborovskii TaxID=109678 RepID=A0AAV0A2A0_PHORO|nr:Cpq [Phodopus roborovskii]
MKFLFMFVSVLHLLSLGSGKAVYKNDISQRTFQEIKEEIASYEDVAKAIINLAVYGKYQNRSYERLGVLVDTVGPRLSGSKNLEKAIQIMYQNLQHDGLENVHLEPVKIPHWERGNESAVMLLPRIHKMSILGLGSSVGTPPGESILLTFSYAETQQKHSLFKISTCEKHSIMIFGTFTDLFTLILEHLDCGAQSDFLLVNGILFPLSLSVKFLGRLVTLDLIFWEVTGVDGVSVEKKKFLNKIGLYIQAVVSVQNRDLYF